jgi:hypothetical protein
MRIEFEKTECTRCGGSGEYSYNPMYGTRCFKCAGKGTHLSKSGTKAYEAWTAAKKEVATISASDVIEGMWIVGSGNRAQKVVRVERGREAGSTRVGDGVALWDSAIGFIFANGGGYSLQIGDTVQRKVTPEEFRTLAEGFREMKGCTIVDEEPANA